MIRVSTDRFHAIRTLILGGLFAAGLTVTAATTAFAQTTRVSEHC
jgi:hypothetical protein